MIRHPIFFSTQYRRRSSVVFHARQFSRSPLRQPLTQHAFVISVRAAFLSNYERRCESLDRAPIERGFALAGSGIGSIPTEGPFPSPCWGRRRGASPATVSSLQLRSPVSPPAAGTLRNSLSRVRLLIPALAAQSG